MRCSAEDREPSNNLSAQSAQTETLASLDLTPELLLVVSIVVAEDLAAPSALSSIDRTRQPKRPPLRSTRPPSGPTTAATQSLTPNLLTLAHNSPHQKKSKVRNYTGPKTIDPSKNGFPGRFRTHRHFVGTTCRSSLRSLTWHTRGSGGKKRQPHQISQLSNER